MPATLANPSFGRVLEDIRAEAARDTRIAAAEALAEIKARYDDLRAMPAATAALLFGSDAAWRQALARVGIELGRRLTARSAEERAAGREPDFSLDEIARPLPHAGGVRWTGD